MKRLIILSAIALLGFASCKKETQAPNPTIIEYYAEGKQLNLTYNDDSGFMFLGHQINGVFNKKFEAKTLDKVFISFSIGKDAPEQIVTVQLKVNGVVLNEFKQKHTQGVDDIPLQTFTVELKNKRD